MDLRAGLIKMVAAALFIAALFGHSIDAQARDSNPVLVFAAASLKNALDAIAAGFESETGNSVKVSYAASSVLAKQLEQDAPADIFISADLDWMDYAERHGSIRRESRIDLLGNRLVLIAPKTSTAALDLALDANLAKLLGNGRLAVGMVDSVPAGKYAKEALQKLGLWNDVADKLAQAENVRAALLLVSRGEAPLGIVYRTDAVSDPNVRIVATFPEGSHAPIIYPAALTPKAGASAAAFIAYLKSDKAAPTFEAQGFTMLGGVKWMKH